MANGHGGYRRPANPAAHSGPGQLSQRTDGNAPGRISGQPYGEGEQANELLSAARQPAGGPPTPSPNAQQSLGSEAAPGTPLPDVFGPTQRPGEPITTPPPSGPAGIPEDPDELLRTLIGLAPDARSRARLIEMLNT